MRLSEIKALGHNGSPIIADGRSMMEKVLSAPRSPSTSSSLKQAPCFSSTFRDEWGSPLVGPGLLMTVSFHDRLTSKSQCCPIGGNYNLRGGHTLMAASLPSASSLTTRGSVPCTIPDRGPTVSPWVKGLSRGERISAPFLTPPSRTSPRTRPSSLYAVLDSS